MQDLVGVRVADAGEEPRIGQRPLQRVVLARKARGERREVDVPDLEAAGVEALERRFTDDVVQRRPPLGSGFGERERAFSELERRKRDPGRRFGAALEPAQPARDHEMQDEVAFARERDDDALAEPAHVVDAPPFGVADRRHGSAQYERIAEPHVEERLSHDARRERLAVDGQVGKFRHRTRRLADGPRRRVRRAPQVTVLGDRNRG